MKHKARLWILLLIPGLIIMSCNLPFALSVPTPTVSAEDAVQLTLTAIEQQNNPENSIATTPPPQQEQITVTTENQVATTEIAPGDSTPTPTDIASPTATITPTEIPCNKASFLADVTYPDGSDVEIGTSFVKTWRIKNTGSCTWTSGYKVIFDHGDRMDAPDETSVTAGTVAPGNTVEISVNLKAPSSTGTYKGYFRLRSPEGELFGIKSGGEENKPFWVEIEAVEPTPTPTATATELVFSPIITLPVIPMLITSCDASYSTKKSCAGKTLLLFKIKNTGSTTLESFSITVKNMTTNETKSNQSNTFRNTSDCISLIEDPIPPDAETYIGSGEWDLLPGVSMQANIKICTQNNLGGVCVEKTVSFIP